MNEPSIIEKAKELMLLANFTEAKKLLLPEIFNNRTNSEFYYLLGISSFKTTDYEGAYSYFKRGLDLAPTKLDLQLSISVVYLLQGKSKIALETWLSIIDRDPDNYLANQGLALLKDAPENIDWSKISIREMLEPLLPWRTQVTMGKALQESKKFNAKHFKRGILAFAASIVLLFVVFVLLKIDPNPKLEPKYIIEEKIRYVLSQDELKNSRQRINEAYNSFQDNNLIREANIYLHSNAVEAEKNEVINLISRVKDPDLLTFKDTISWENVSKDPFQFQNCYVKWDAVIANTFVFDGKLAGLGLINYHPEDSLSGSVNLVFPNGYNISQGDSLEFLGKVIYRVEEKAGFYIRVISMKQLAKK